MNYATADLYSRDQNALASTEKLRFFPLAVVGGRGCYLIEDGGRELLDLSATWSAAPLGYGNQVFGEKIAAVLRNPAGAGIGSIANEPAVVLAERLLEVLPGDGDRRVYLGHSGSDANEAAVRAIQHASGRTGVLAFHGSYHGGLQGSRTYSGLMVDAGGLAAPSLQLIDFPDSYRHGDVMGRSLEQLDAALAAKPAVLLIEPIMSDGGMAVPPSGFLRAVGERCRHAGVTVLCDEVKVGFGRTGLWAECQRDGLQPDVITLGKALGNGLPISAAIGPAAVFDTAEAFSMLTTAGNPVCSTAALAVMQEIDHLGLLEMAANLGNELRCGLEELARRHELIGDVRGHGLAIGVEIVADRGRRIPHANAAAKLVYRAWELGAVMFCVGANSNVIELTPPLIINRSQIDRALDIFDTALSDVEAGRVADSDVAAFAGW